MSVASGEAFFKNGKPFGSPGGGRQNGGSTGGPGFGRYKPNETKVEQNRGFGPTLSSLGGGGTSTFGAPPQGCFSSPAVGGRGGSTGGNGGGTSTFGAPPQGGFSSPAVGGRGGSTAGNGGGTSTFGAHPQGGFSSPAVGGRGGFSAGNGRLQTPSGGIGRGMNSPRPAGFQRHAGFQQTSGARNYADGPTPIAPGKVLSNVDLNPDWVRYEKEIEEEDAKNPIVDLQNPQQIDDGEAVVHNPPSNVQQQHQPVPNNGPFSSSGSRKQWGEGATATRTPTDPSTTVGHPSVPFSASGGHQWSFNAPMQASPVAGSGGAHDIGGGGGFSTPSRIAWNPVVEPSSPPGPCDVMAPFSAEKTYEPSVQAQVHQPQTPTHQPQTLFHQPSAQTNQSLSSVFQQPANNYQPPAQQYVNNINNTEQQHHAVTTAVLKPQPETRLTDFAKAHRDHLAEAEQRRGRTAPAQAASTTDTSSSNESPKKSDTMIQKEHVDDFAKCCKQLSEAMENFNKLLKKMAN